MVVEGELGDEEDGRMDRSATRSVAAVFILQEYNRGDFCKKSSKCCDSVYAIS